MTDFHVGNLFPDPPRRPVRSAAARRSPRMCMPRSRRATDVFRCKRCNVEYPVTKKAQA